MHFSLWPGPQQPWSDVLALAQHAEATGWDGVWFPDHFMPDGADVSIPVLECWSVLAGLAVAVPRVRLGSLVSGNTYRHPAVLTKIAVTVDHLSGGRLVLGLGAGWQENEHRAYGIDFYDTAERLARLDEACQVVKGLLSAERATFKGQFYQLQDAPLEPKPLQPKLPLLIGGSGERITLRIAARHADEWNTWGTPDMLRHKIGVLERHCADIGRDPKEIKKSAQALVFMRDDPEWLAARRASATGGQPMIIGTPAEVRATVEEYADAGVDEFVLPDFSLGRGERKVATIDQFFAEVASPLR
ncbi:MAG TPA: LLM class F420-dependent oxidoreductase [Acidimicrobiales bacterium]|nr:LLM class F420-dependent oxidoreductase [Acidimicrobiales bacterium]